MEFLGVVLVLVAASCLAGVFRPRAVWRRTMAWRYSDPDAVEPSDASFTLSALGSATAVVCCTWLAFVAFGTAADRRWDTACQNAREVLLEVADLTPEGRVKNDLEVLDAAQGLGVIVQVASRPATVVDAEGRAMFRLTQVDPMACS